MTEHTLSRVLHYSTAKGTPRMVLMVLATCANWRGGVSMPLRTIADFCNVTKTAVSDAIAALVDTGELVIVDSGGGKATPASYRVNVRPLDTPRASVVVADTKPAPAPPIVVEAPPPPAPVMDPEPVFAPASKAPEPAPDWNPPEGVPATDVGRVLVAARVEIDPMAGLYWHRTAHRDDLAALVAEEGDLSAVIARLKAGHPAGAIRRLTQLRRAI